MRALSTAWKRAFRYAFRVLVFSALWVIIGSVLIFGGITLMASSVTMGAGAFLGALIMFTVGYILIYVGFLAALFRYLPEALREEVERRR